MTDLDFRPDAVAIVTSDFFYDLAEGGYIDLNTLLSEADATRVREAVNLIRDFQSQAESRDLIEYT